MDYGGRKGRAWSEPRTVVFALWTDPTTASPDRGLGLVVAAGGSDTIQVSAESLDDYSWTQPLPDFLKCDVEGAGSRKRVRGASRLLKKKRPGIICEMHSDENQHAFFLKSFRDSATTCTPCRKRTTILALPQ